MVSLHILNWSSILDVKSRHRTLNTTDATLDSDSFWLWPILNCSSAYRALILAHRTRNQCMEQCPTEQKWSSNLPPAPASNSAIISTLRIYVFYLRHQVSPRSYNQSVFIPFERYGTHQRRGDYFPLYVLSASESYEQGCRCSYWNTSDTIWRKCATLLTVRCERFSFWRRLREQHQIVLTRSTVKSENESSNLWSYLNISFWRSIVTFDLVMEVTLTYTATLEYNVEQ